MLIIFDCNVWITLALNGQLDYITNLSHRKNVIASCIQLRSEITSVLYRPKLQKFILESDIIKAIELHDLVTTTYKTGKIFNITSDPKDDYLFALASKSKADYLVTGDKLLLSVVTYKNTALISLAEFKSVINI